jgi:NhaP-type Na+/H+ and K+/H+ antiporter
MYYFAEFFHFSGVLAVVTGGLFLSSRRNTMLSYQSRIQGVNVWTILGFALNGLIFLLIGLQMPSIVQQLGGITIGRAIWYGLAISGVIIIARLLSTLGASLFTRFMSHFITVADPNPGWRTPLIFGWAGMRGVVSLAAALSIPLMIGNGRPFPYRNLILFITFIVILVTLVFQGLTLPWVIRKLNPEDKYAGIPEDKQEMIIQKKIAQASLQLLEEKYGAKWVGNDHLDNLYAKLKIDLKFFNDKLEFKTEKKKNPLKDYQAVYLEILEEQRRLLNRMNNRAEFDEELIRKYLSFVDIEEMKLRQRLIVD